MSSYTMRVDDEVYRVLLAEKHRMEAEAGGIVSIGDAVRSLMLPPEAVELDNPRETGWVADIDDEWDLAVGGAVAHIETLQGIARDLGEHDTLAELARVSDRLQQVKLGERLHGGLANTIVTIDDA